MLFKHRKKHCINKGDFISSAIDQEIPMELVELAIQEIDRKVEFINWDIYFDRRTKFDISDLRGYLYKHMLIDLIHWNNGQIDHGKWESELKYIRTTIKGDVINFFNRTLYKISRKLIYEKIKAQIKFVNKDISEMDI